MLKSFLSDEQLAHTLKRRNCAPIHQMDRQALRVTRSRTSLCQPEHKRPSSTCASKGFDHLLECLRWQLRDYPHLLPLMKANGEI